MKLHMIRAISSPSSSTIGSATLIFAIDFHPRMRPKGRAPSRGVPAREDTGRDTARQVEVGAASRPRDAPLTHGLWNCSHPREGRTTRPDFLKLTELLPPVYRYYGIFTSSYRISFMIPIAWKSCLILR